MQGTDFCEGFVDMNVIYEKRRHERAVATKKIEEKIRKETIVKREEAKEMEKFKAKIHGDDSGLTLSDLRKLNSVYKKEYISAMMEDSDMTAFIMH